MTDHLVDPSRRRLLELGGAAAAACALRPIALLAVSPFDLVLRGGLVLDGTGMPAFRADIGVVGQRIAAIGTIAAEQGRRVLDISGMHVCPGFIDIHTHSDGDILVYPTADSRVRQGITTELTGNCGGSAAPLGGKDAEEDRKAYRRDGIDAAWSGVATYLDAVDKAGISINHALLVGQGTIRANAIGNIDRTLSPAELSAVIDAVEDAMEQGAFGLSTGLEYTPGRYTPTAEIVAMARVVGRRGGLYASHVRNEEASLLEAIDEAIAIGRESGARVQISHLKASGRPNWGKQQGAIDLIASARRDGVNVLADAYPYTAYSTSLTTFLSAEAREGGTRELMARLKDKVWRARMVREVETLMARELGDYALIVIARVKSTANRAVVGKNMVEIAAAWGISPVDAVLRLLEEEEGAVSIIGHGMSEDNVERVLGHPLVMVGSDGYSMAPVGRAAEARPHPRSYGAFARVLARYVRERHTLSLEQAVRKMTSMPADQIGLGDRGRIARGKQADLVVFDPATVKDQATFEQPHQYATGMPHVIVNGTLVVENGRHTGAKPGRAIRRT
ncbi:MAG: D-aminoacylase [Acidobacteriota bacterium]